MTTPLDLARRHYAAATAGDAAADEALFDPNVETVTPTGTLKTYEEFAAMNKGFADAITDMRFEIVNSFSEGDTAVVEGVFSGRHTGALRTPDGEIPASGNAVSFPFVDIFQVRDDRCVSHRVYWDSMAMMAQLGALS